MEIKDGQLKTGSRRFNIRRNRHSRLQTPRRERSLLRSNRLLRSGILFGAICSKNLTRSKEKVHRKVSFLFLFSVSVTDNLFVVTHKFPRPHLTCFCWYKNLAATVKMSKKIIIFFSVLTTVELCELF
jgi:hypothetical protein